MENTSTATNYSVIKVEHTRKKCDVCGKKHWMWAMVWSVVGDKSLIPQKELGPWKRNKEYKICYPCLMKKLGFKP